MLVAATPSPANPVLDRAREALGDAQSVAADVANAPAVATREQIAVGMGDAATAAALLSKATPDSQYQDLRAAADLANLGVRELSHALTVIGSDAAAIKRHAVAAFDAFENAFEIIDNN